MIKVTVFNEYWHEVAEESIRKIYPGGIHGTIADFLSTEDDIAVRTITLLDEKGELIPNCGGITKELLEDTDVLIWWAHAQHRNVPDEIAQLIATEVQAGMGAVFLHSAHYSKPFKALMGTSGSLSWRECAKERLWNICPSHPIMQGIGEYFDLEQEEMYGERFDIPTPDEVLMIGTYDSHEVFRSACTWRRGNGNIFYFQPGHESYPIYYNENIQTIIKNAVRWAAPTYRLKEIPCPEVQVIEF